MKKISLFALLTLGGAASAARANQIGTTAGLTLLNPPGARAAALGEAFSAVTNDITAFHYNPATLQTMETGQASFAYEKGMQADTFGQFIAGIPSRYGAFGLSVGYYDSGKITLTDENLTSSNVTGESDMTASLGYANRFRSIHWGAAGKYLSSKLVNQYSAHAFALDLGLQSSLSARWSVGVAAQNLGTQMTYLSNGYDLPRIYRAGTSFLLLPGRYATSLLLDLPYYYGDKEMRPGVGVEVMAGPIALRAGYEKSSGLNKTITAGAGFQLGGWGLDYSFGMVDQLHDQQHLSVSMRFGNGAAPMPENFSLQPVTPKEGVSPYHAPSYSPSPQQPPAGSPRPTGAVPSMNSAPFEPQVPASNQALPQTIQPPAKFAKPKLKTPLHGHTLGDHKNLKKLNTTYVIRPGDTLAKIAERYYGDANQWKRIYEANQVVFAQSKKLKVGMKIFLP